ncbi:MAG: hypothetical protein R3B09_31325 [Nannocystaceae bacterium]
MVLASEPRPLEETRSRRWIAGLLSLAVHLALLGLVALGGPRRAEAPEEPTERIQLVELAALGPPSAGPPLVARAPEAPSTEPAPQASTLAPVVQARRSPGARAALERTPRPAVAPLARTAEDAPASVPADEVTTAIVGEARIVGEPRPRAATRPSSGGDTGASADLIAAYGAEIVALLKRERNRARGTHGGARRAEMVLVLKIRADGSLVALQQLRGRRSALRRAVSDEMEEEILRIIRRAADDFPPFPEGLERSNLEIEVAFRLDRAR